MAVPVMRMGLIGFADETYLANLLMTRSRFLRWERWPFVEADALWVNGEHALPVRNNMIRIPSAQPNKAATVLNMKEVDRPMAFTLPLGTPTLQPPMVFDPHVATSVAEVLGKFEEALMPVACQLALADEIAGRRYQLSSPIYHLSVHGALVGVVNVSGDIGLAPRLTPVDVASAEWGGRPSAASEIPPGFVRTTMAQVMWQYVMRSGQDIIPSRYRTAPIYFRRMPKVPARMMRDQHLVVISELQGSGPQTVPQLKQNTGLVDAQIEPVLAALYFAGALTLDPKKATGVSRDSAPSDLWVTQPGMPSETVPPRPGKRSHAEMPTVPTPLQRDD